MIWFFVYCYMTVFGPTCTGVQYQVPPVDVQWVAPAGSGGSIQGNIQSVPQPQVIIFPPCQPTVCA